MDVDASVWVSGLVSEDTHHKATNAWLSQRLAGGDTLVIPSLALAEVAGAISRRTGLVAQERRSARDRTA